MTRDDIIKLAQESGLHSAVMLLDVTEKSLTATEADQLEAIIDFAERVTKAEREACAQIAKQWDKDHPRTNYGGCIALIIEGRK